MQNALSVLTIIFYALSAIYFYIKFFLNKEKTRTLAFLFLLLGFAAHGLDLLVFSFEQHRLPAANLVEAFSLLTWLMILLFLFLSRRNEMDPAAVLLLPVTIISIILMALFRGGSPSVDPLLRAGWIYVHIPLMILSVASLSISFVTAVMYLLQERQLKSKHPAFFYYRLPSLEVCEDLSYKSLWFGFFLLTLGIITGMIWNKYLRAAYWIWDYKEIWALITWSLYAVLIHGRMLAAWRGRKAAYMAIVGFVLILFTFAGVSLLFKGYHLF